jgi:hypothetical protein
MSGMATNLGKGKLGRHHPSLGQRPRWAGTPLGNPKVPFHKGGQGKGVHWSPWGLVRCPLGLAWPAPFWQPSRPHPLSSFDVFLSYVLESSGHSGLHWNRVSPYINKYFIYSNFKMLPILLVITFDNLRSAAKT